MPLKFKDSWRFDSPGKVPPDVVWGFLQLIRKISTQGIRKTYFEHFKGFFVRAMGETHYSSTNESWAETDLITNMQSASENGPLFIEAFYDACEALKLEGKAVPGLEKLNRVLAESNSGYEISPPNLNATGIQKVIKQPPLPRTLSEEAQNEINLSFDEAEKLLAEGRYRQAVQENLWLLETVVTIFDGQKIGENTVQGRYFNKIIPELRKNQKGQTLEQALRWIKTLHGFLSSPTGGGVRHGTDLKKGINLQPEEARLFCNLIRSYISFLISEHSRINSK